MDCDFSPIAAIIDSSIVFFSDRGDMHAVGVLENILHELIPDRNQEARKPSVYESESIFEQEALAAALFLQMNARMDAACRLLRLVNQMSVGKALGFVEHVS